MIDTLTIIAFSTAFFFMLLTLNILRLNRKTYKTRMDGTRALVKRTKKLRAKREAQFRETSALAKMDETKIEALWLSELEFYQNISDTICVPDEKSIKKVTTYVTKLLTPYYELADEAAIQGYEIDDEQEETSIEQEAAPQESSSSEQTASVNTEEFETLEMRYHEKIEENERLLKQIDTLKKQGKAKAPSDESEPAEDMEDSEDKSRESVDNTAIGEQLKPILESFEKISEVEHKEIAAHEIDALIHHFKAIKVKLEEKVEKFDFSNDDFDQTEAIIEQLRVEKVGYLKKYRRSMNLLFSTYKEYASAFGLESPKNPNIEIDEFEKFIDEN